MESEKLHWGQWAGVRDFRFWRDRDCELIIPMMSTQRDATYVKSKAEAEIGTPVAISVTPSYTAAYLLYSLFLVPSPRSHLPRTGWGSPLGAISDLTLGRNCL